MEPVKHALLQKGSGHRLAVPIGALRSSEGDQSLSAWGVSRTIAVIDQAKLLAFGICEQQWSRDLIDYVGEVVSASCAEHVEGGIQTVGFCPPLPVLPLGQSRRLLPWSKNRSKVCLSPESRS